MALPAREAELLDRINTELSETLWTEYRDL